DVGPQLAASAARGRGRVWVILSHRGPEEEARVLAALGGLQVAGRIEAAGAAALLLVSPARPPPAPGGGPGRGGACAYQVALGAIDPSRPPVFDVSGEPPGPHAGRPAPGPRRATAEQRARRPARRRALGQHGGHRGDRRGPERAAWRPRRVRARRARGRRRGVRGDGAARAPRGAALAEGAG